MSTDKTLADVQPGGRVRLEEHRGELDPTRIAETVGAREYGVPPYRYFAFTTDQLAAFAAALSAKPSPATCKEGLQVQPSPDGQGAPERCAECRHTTFEVHPDGHICVHCKLIVAARQPVGEPVAWMDPDGSRVLTAKAKANASGAYKSATSGYTVPLVPLPAQAVDLGQFRDLAEFALSNAKLHNCWEKREALARDLLALIDGQAVGK